ncbi:hypothetical protein DPMN_114855 [Dreissena polymorpha]|uniref:Uncharacterized protein n=1 Tax=Dreissena polymorpha TaxID=45954 RepID=A0A9D4QS51_DREPO|nr:hypothetical protein DPMN_114855 [Dreissena polymorpha]
MFVWTISRSSLTFGKDCMNRLLSGERTRAVFALLLISPEHKVLLVSLCDRNLSVMRRQNLP